MSEQLTDSLCETNTSTLCDGQECFNMQLARACEGRCGKCKETPGVFEYPAQNPEHEQESLLSNVVFMASGCVKTLVKCTD